VPFLLNVERPDAGMGARGNLWCVGRRVDAASIKPRGSTRAKLMGDLSSSSVCNRRTTIVKVLIRGFGVALLLVTLLGLYGCSSDNESEAQKLQNNLGTPPTPTVKGPAETKPLPTDQGQRGDPNAQKSEYATGKATSSGTKK
jgi:hypothetical protein